MNKIALIGSAPSSVTLAPYDDPSWTIWGCSPGAYPHVKRADAWFEMHRHELDKPWFSAEYIKFMASRVQGPVYVVEPWPEIPNALIYPKDEMLAQFGPYVFASSLSWMLALAISRKPKEIGLWGVDMSAEEEWVFQRPACQTLIWIARGLGIKVTLPPESDLLRPPPLYGFCETDPMHIKLLKRKEELTARVQGIDQQLQALSNERMYLLGAMSDNEYMLRTWISDRYQIDMAYGAEVRPAQVVDDAMPVWRDMATTSVAILERKPKAKTNGVAESVGV